MHDDRLSEVLELDAHKKAVSSICTDPSGSRMITGSYDAQTKVFDFEGMNNAKRSAFREFCYKERMPVVQLAFDATGHTFLVGSASTPALYTRDGLFVNEWSQGDPYIMDLKRTIGHVADITCVCWNPKETDKFMTGSKDGTLRIWKLSEISKCIGTIVVKSMKASSTMKGRIAVTSCDWSSDAKYISCGNETGALYVYDSKSTLRPYKSNEKAHSGPISDVLFLPGSRKLASRSLDGSFALWDTKNLSEPIARVGALPCRHDQTNICFVQGLEEDDFFFVTGVTEEHGDKFVGSIVTISKDGAFENKRYIANDSIATVHWNSKLRQLFVGLGSGQISILYSHDVSVRGALLIADRKPKQKVEDWAARSTEGAHLDSSVIAPNLLPLFQSENDVEIDEDGNISNKTRLELGKKRAALKPAPPLESSRGSGGRIGGISATRQMVKNLLPSDERDDIRIQDPREALLQYEGKEKKWTSAWDETQPKPVFSETEEKEDDENQRKRLKPIF